MTAERVVYFGYGSNLDPRTFIGRRKMRPERSAVARLDDYRLVFDLAVGAGERAAANVRPERGAQVWGVAYWISFEESQRLDRSEGVHRGVYLRRRVLLTLESGDPVDAFTYGSTRGVSGRKPSHRYMSLLLRGARYHSMPSAYVSYLRSFPLARDERQQELF